MESLENDGFCVACSLLLRHFPALVPDLVLHVGKGRCGKDRLLCCFSRLATLFGLRGHLHPAMDGNDQRGTDSSRFASLHSSTHRKQCCRYHPLGCRYHPLSQGESGARESVTLKFRDRRFETKIELTSSGNTFSSTRKMLSDSNMYRFALLIAAGDLQQNYQLIQE